MASLQLKTGIASATTPEKPPKAALRVTLLTLPSSAAAGGSRGSDV
jgi:hypothetical protein